MFRFNYYSESHCHEFDMAVLPSLVSCSALITTVSLTVMSLTWLFCFAGVTHSHAYWFLLVLLQSFWMCVCVCGCVVCVWCVCVCFSV